MKKETTDILDRNGGMHKQRAYRNIRAMFDNHGFRSPRLFHIVLTIAESKHEYETKPGPIQVAQFKKVLRALCLKLTEAGNAYRWRACVEFEADKGWHLHVFMLVSNAPNSPCDIIQPKRTNGEWSMRQMMDNHSVSFHIATPMAPMHKVGGLSTGDKQNFAYNGTPEKLADCLKWVSYLVKKRSKPTDTKQIYFSSRDTITKKDAKPKAIRRAKATRIVQRTGIDHEPPQTVILDPIDATSPAVFVLESDSIGIVSVTATRINAPTAPALIDHRQRDMFDQPVSEPNDQPTAGKSGQRVSDERRATIMAILLDPERGQLSDRAISRETGVSAIIVKAMRATITPDDSQVRTFHRGGKTYTMNAANIGKRPADQCSTLIIEKT